MADDEIVILASDSDSDGDELEILSSGFIRPTSIREFTTCSRKSLANVTSSKCYSFTSNDKNKTQTIGKVISGRCVVSSKITENNGTNIDNINNNVSRIPNSKSDVFYEGSKNGHSIENVRLRGDFNKKAVAGPTRSVRNDVSLSHISDSGIWKDGLQDESHCQIMNIATCKGKFEGNGLVPSTSTSTCGFVDEKCSGVIDERNTFEEIFEDDIQMALAISLQPHYMPKFESTNCDNEDDSVVFSPSKNIMHFKPSGAHPIQVDKLEHNVTETSKRKSCSFEKIKKRKKSKQLTRTTKYRKVSNTHSQDFDFKDNETKKNKFIKPIIINLVDESEDDFSDDLPDIDVQIINTPIKKEFKSVEVNSNFTIPCEYDRLDDFEIPAKQIKLSQKESKCNTKESNLSKSNLLFTSEHKNKLAKLLSTVSYKSTGKPKKDKLAFDGEANDCLEGSRHWMDCLDSLNQSHKLPNESDYQSDTSLESIKILASSQGSDATFLIQPPLRSVEYCQSDDSQESVASEDLSSMDSLFPNCTKSKVNDTQDWIDQNVNQCAQSEDNIELTADGTSVSLRNIQVVQQEAIDNGIVSNHSYSNQYYTSINKMKFSSSSVVNNLVESFSAMHIYSLEAAIEEGDAFFDCSLDILKGFVVQNKPTLKVLDDILFKGLLGKYSAYICVKCYNILRFVWQTYPDLIQIDWDVLCDKIGGVTYQSNSSSTTNLQSGLLLHLYVFGFEMNIFQNSIRNRSKLIRTYAFKLLSEDCAFSNLKLIITWIEFCINSSSHEGITEAFLQGEVQMPAELTEKHLINFDVPYKLLPDLNRLLELGIDISKNCVDAARRIASELEKTYIYVSDIKQKKILIHLVCSDLLQLKLIQRVMEDYCDGIVPTPTNFPLSFAHLKDSYFNGRPPRSPICTPPQSPNNGDFHGLDNVIRDYTPESVEELSLLVYYAAKSYLNCIKRCLHDPLHQRYCQKSLSDEDKYALESLPEKAMEFYRHLQSLNPHLTPAAQQNCIMLTCLSETFL